MQSNMKAADELGEIVDQKLSSLIRELEDADWPTEDVVFAIDDVIQRRWMGQLDALRKARLATPTDFVSDGNEG